MSDDELSFLKKKKKFRYNFQKIFNVKITKVLIVGPPKTQNVAHEYLKMQRRWNQDLSIRMLNNIIINFLIKNT